MARVIVSPDQVDSSILPQILAAGLGGAMRARLPDQHALRDALRGQALDLAMRHACIRAELRTLLGAWSADGIPVLIFKGFALAEFEYATPGERFYGDVDVLLPESHDLVIRAAHIALALGWRNDGLYAHPESWTHETMHLYSPGGNVRIDVHRWLISPLTGIAPARVRSLTEGVWQRSTEVDWQGIEVRLSDPLDAAVVNLALSRCWGGDSGGLKPADYLDLQLLQKNHGLDSDVLLEHAARVGGSGTWIAFNHCCSPEQHRFLLDRARTAPVLAQGLAKDGLDLRRGLQSFRRKQRRQKLARTWPHLMPAAFDVAAAWWALREGGDPRLHLARWTPPEPPVRVHLSFEELSSRLTAVSWWTRLLYPRQRKRGICVPRAYATYRILRRAGHPAVFISGAARQGGKFIAHAWVEDDRGAIESYGEAGNRRAFQVVFSYPQAH